MDELKTRHLRDLRATRGTQRLSPKTVKNIIGSSLRALARDAISDELLTTEPFVGLKWERTIRKKPDPFTASERDKILGWFATKRRWYYPFVFTLFHTGMRPSEKALADSRGARAGRDRGADGAAGRTSGNAAERTRLTVGNGIKRTLSGSPRRLLGRDEPLGFARRGPVG